MVDTFPVKTSNPKIVSEMLLPLLLGSGVLNRKELETAKKVAVELELSLEEAIVDSGMVDEDDMKVPMEALSRVEAKKITLDLAIRAVRIALHKKVTLDDAITAIGDVHKSTGVVVTATNDLTKILLASNIIDRDQLGKALKKSSDSSTMIGHLLVLSEVVTVKSMLAALNAIHMVRDVGLDPDKAVQGMRYANGRDITFEQALFELGFFIHPDSKDIRIEELFHMSGIISPSDLAECMEIELFKKKDFGQILLERGMITNDQLDSARTLLASIGRGTLRPYQAAQALSDVCRLDKDVYATIAEFQLLYKPDTNDRLGDLLVEGGACSREQMEKAFSMASESAVKIGSVLLKSKIIKETTLYDALRVQTLFRFGYIDRPTMIALLSYCVNNKTNLDGALEEMGINVPSRMQWTWV